MSNAPDGLDLDAVRSEIARIAPEFDGRPVSWLGEGMDSVAVMVGGSFVFRFAKHAEAGAGLRREIALLPRLAPSLRLAIPQIAWAGEQVATGLPFVGYPHIPGIPLDRDLFERLPDPQREGIFRELAAFLEAVHAFPAEEAAACGVRPHGERSAYQDDLERARAEVWPLLDIPFRRAADAELAAFLADDGNFAHAPRLLHGDLWPEHVLYSEAEGKLAGIIDFADVSLGDPAYDLAFLTLRLGPGFLAGMLRHAPHPGPEQLARLARGFALFNAVEDALVGLDRGDRSLLASAVRDLSDLMGAGRPR